MSLAPWVPLLPIVEFEGELIFYGGHLLHDGVEVPLPQLPDGEDPGNGTFEQSWSQVIGVVMSEAGHMMITTGYGAYLYDLYPND